MLSKVNRLTKDKDFENVFKKGRFISEDFLSCKFIKNNLSVSRLGFLVGKKISKKAVERNKIKRRLRASVRNFFAEINSGFDIIIMVQPIIKEKTFQEIALILKKLFLKARFISAAERT